jgi:hypothetical protein
MLSVVLDLKYTDADEIKPFSIRGIGTAVIIFIAVRA